MFRITISEERTCLPYGKQLDPGLLFQCLLPDMRNGDRSGHNYLSELCLIKRTIISTCANCDGVRTKVADSYGMSIHIKSDMEKPEKLSYLFETTQRVKMMMLHFLLPRNIFYRLEYKSFPFFAFNMKSRHTRKEFKVRRHALYARAISTKCLRHCLRNNNG